MRPKKRVAILISGRGSNMAALIEAASRPAFPGEVALVLSNRPDAGGLALAVASGIATAIISHKDFSTREGFEASVEAVLRSHAIDLVCLAGFMRVLTPQFVERWRGSMINIHPSLLPSFRGVHTHERALEAGVRVHGCTVHFVEPELDAGPIIAQACVPVRPADTAETLAARVLAEENTLYPRALQMVLDGSVRLENGRAAFRNDDD